MATNEPKVPEDPTSDFMASGEFAAQLRHPVTWRKRVAPIALGGLALATTIALILHPNFVPQVTPPLPITAHVHLHSLVNYGTLRVNGQAQTFLPGGLIGLHNGINQVTLDAPPFHQVGCAIDIPTHARDTCLVENTSDSSKSDLLLPITLHDLPPDLIQSALHTLHQTLTDVMHHLQTTVAVGERYLSGFDPKSELSQTQVTHIPLTATLVLRATIPDACLLVNFTVDCLTTDITAADAAMPVWGIPLAIEYYWRFTDANAHSVADFSATPQSISVDFLLHYHAGWQIIIGQGSVSSTSLSQMTSLATTLAELACESSIFALFNSGVTSLNVPTNTFTLTHVGIEGCETTLPVLEPMGGNEAHLVARFGVVYAADLSTAQLSLALPLATPQQIALIESQG